MATGHRIFYEFGPFRVDPEKQVLLCENLPVPVTPRTLETLLVLVRRNREVVSKDDLMKELWPDSFVEEANLSQNISMLRKALGDTPEDRRYIVTLPGKGYRFVAEVRTVTQNGDDLVIASHSQVVVEQTDGAPTETLPALPAAEVRRFNWKLLLTIGAGVVLLALGAIVYLLQRRPTVLGEKDSVVIADFRNTTNDPVFDETLRQGLEVQLEQSPYLRLISDRSIQQTLRLMGQTADAPLTPELAREICERSRSAVVFDGSIANLGSRYVLGLRARDCHTGNLLAEEQVQVARREDVLNALSQIASRIRTRLGEPLATVEKHDTPLEEATTPSLEALKAYSTGWRVHFSSGPTAATPYFERAIELDPKFASAYAALGGMYGIKGESALSAENTRKAYELRDGASDKERFFIIAAYDGRVTGNLERAQETSEAWAQAYPRDVLPLAALAGFIYPASAEYEKSVELSQKIIGLDPDFADGYLLLATNYVCVDRLEDAESTLRRAAERKLETADDIVLRYDVAFLKGDEAGMQRELALAQGRSGAEDLISQHQAFVLAYAGHVQQASMMSHRAADLARQSAHRERAALYDAGAALWEAFFGNVPTAGRTALAALQLSNDREAEFGAAFALALSGDSSRSQTLADDLEKRFPEDTSVRFSYLPAVLAVLALNRGEPSKAIELLQTAVPYELGVQRSSIHGNFGALYPIYVRGEAYLAAHQGAEAAKEFQKIFDHRRIVVSDPVGAVARLQLARAYAMKGDTGNARAAYQNFLTLWKDADLDIPIYQQAKAEYAKLL